MGCGTVAAFADELLKPLRSRDDLADYLPSQKPQSALSPDSAVSYENSGGEKIDCILYLLGPSHFDAFTGLYCGAVRNSGITCES